MKRALCATAIFALVVVGSWDARAIPIGFSAMGGIGYGYYSMTDLNNHLGLIRQTRSITIDEIANGINFKFEGRVWFFDRFAVSGGYEHFWAESVTEGSSSTLSYKAPADVYLIGAVVMVFTVPNVFDLCLGVNRCGAETVFGTNEVIARRLSEYKGEKAGVEAYAEIHTNFINPIEVGMQFGYRGLKVSTLNDKWGDVGVFDEGITISIDYSGFFFYLMTAIRI